MRFSGPECFTALPNGEVYVSAGECRGTIIGDSRGSTAFRRLAGGHQIEPGHKSASLDFLDFFARRWLTIPLNLLGCHSYSEVDDVLDLQCLP